MTPAVHNPVRISKPKCEFCEKFVPKAPIYVFAHSAQVQEDGSVLIRIVVQHISCRARSVTEKVLQLKEEI